LATGTEKNPGKYPFTINILTEEITQAKARLRRDHHEAGPPVTWWWPLTIGNSNFLRGRRNTTGTTWGNFNIKGVRGGEEQKPPQFSRNNL